MTLKTIMILALLVLTASSPMRPVISPIITGLDVGDHVLAVTYDYVTDAPETASVYPSLRDKATGLFAHEHLAGQYYKDIKTGQKIVLAYSDGTQAVYTVVAIRIFKATIPYGQHADESHFIEYPSKREYTRYQLMTELLQDGNLVLMTCQSYDGVLWGRLAIIAERRQT